MSYIRISCNNPVFLIASIALLIFLSVPSAFTENEPEIERLISNLDTTSFQDAKAAKQQLTALGTKAVPQLIARLPQSPEVTKAKIAFILGKIADRKAAPALVKTLHDKNAYVRRNTVEALGRIKDPIAFNGLVGALYDDDDTVKERAAWALGELGDSRAADELLNLLAVSEEEPVKITTLRSLGKLKSRKATIPLINEFNSKSDQTYKDEVVIALGEIADKSALSELRAYRNILNRKLLDARQKDMKYIPGGEMVRSMVIFQYEESIKKTSRAIQNIENSNK